MSPPPPQTPPFSARIPWHLPQNALSQAVAQRRAAGAELLDLTVSNPTRALPELYAGDAGTRLLSALADPRGLRYDPSPQGAAEARSSVAAYYAARGLPLDPAQLVLCASTSEAYAWLFQLLCDPGDHVLFPQPSYPLLDFLAGLSGVAVDAYPLRYEPGPGGRWSIDLPALSSAVTERTRAVVVVSPNNPTGSLVHRGELRALRRLCHERGLALIADEVFSDYRLDETDPSDPGVPSLWAKDDAAAGDGAPLGFVLSGLSKVVGLPQLKLGWIGVTGPEPLRSHAQDRLELIADTFLSVGTPVQLAVPQILHEQPRLRAGIGERLTRNLATLRARVRGTACQLLTVEGGWSAVVRLPRVLSEEEWALRLLARDGVLVQPGYFFDFADEAYAVLSLLTPPAVWDAGIGRLVGRVQSEL